MCCVCARRKRPAESLITLNHPRVISKATFSPHTGRCALEFLTLGCAKLLTYGYTQQSAQESVWCRRIVSTCGDNRLRVWDDVVRACDTPDREIVHSHDFNRYLTNFQAVFDPKVCSPTPPTPTTPVHAQPSMDLLVVLLPWLYSTEYLSACKNLTASIVLIHSAQYSTAGSSTHGSMYPSGAGPDRAQHGHWAVHQRGARWLQAPPY